MRCVTKSRSLSVAVWLGAGVLVATLTGAPLLSSQHAHAQGMKFKPEEIKRVPPSRTLARAKKMYGKGDYYSASIEFYKVISKETKDSEANRQRAEFFMGKTLFKMGFYAGSLAYFDRIVTGGDDEKAQERAGRAHRYFNATLKWLAALSNVLPETSGILDKIGKYDAQDLKDPALKDVREELFYLLGRHFYAKGKFGKAVELFRKVPRTSKHFIKAKFFEGVTFVRKSEGRPAVAAFKDILIIGKEKPKYYTKKEISKFVTLANLQMARVFYSSQDYKTSIRYYEKLTQSSPDWLDSLFEASWGYFEIANNSKALGNIHTLNAPYFENQFFPESMILRAVIYYTYCLYDRAMESVSEYNKKFKPLRKNLKEVMDKFQDNAKFYKYIRQIIDGKAGGLEPATQRLILSVLTDKTIKKSFTWVEELDRELKLHKKADQAWQTTAIASEVLQELTLQLSLAKADAGKLARERITRLRKELQEFAKDGLKIRYEVNERRTGQVTAKAKGEQLSGSHKEEPIVVDDEHFMWKFNGEYWKDELGYYRFRIRSKCPKRGAK